MTPIDPTRAARVRELAQRAVNSEAAWRNAATADEAGAAMESMDDAAVKFQDECDPAFILSLLDAASRGGGDETRLLDIAELTADCPSSTDYLAHFNKVVGNYAEAVAYENGTERHQRAARSVDHLAKEYALATDLLDRVTGACHARIEHAAMSGLDATAVTEAFGAQYPPLAEELRGFLATVVDFYSASSATSADQ